MADTLDAHESDDALMVDAKLRDAFAAHALTGLLSGIYRDTCMHNLREAPQEAYAIADAMLAARSRPA